jgi:hypothetical protein
MSEEEVKFVKVDALKRILRNLNVTVKVSGIGEPHSVTSRKMFLCTELQGHFKVRKF